MRKGKNKIDYLSGLVKKRDYDRKISEMKGNCITTSDQNKFTSDELDAKTKTKSVCQHI